MVRRAEKYYPTFWQAVNLIVLYTFLQTIIDFPLALYDYQHGTDWLQEPLLKLPVFFGTTIVILLLGARYTGLSGREIFPMKGFHWTVVPAALISLVALQFYMNEITYNIDRVLPPPGWFLELFNRIFESDFGIWGGIIRVILIAPVVEEMIFRGVIFSGFRRNYSPFWAIFLSALLFALFHLNPWQLGPTFLLGLLLGYVRLKTGSLLASIFTHALHNAIIFYTVYYKIFFMESFWQQTGQLPAYLVSAFLLTAGVLLIHYSSRTRKQEARR
jgi:membrane protease YdiL (CAAX protease family)